MVRIVKGLPADVTIAPNVIISDNGRINSILSLLLHGNQNCIIHEAKDPIAEEETTVQESTTESAQNIVEQEDLTEEREETNENNNSTKKKKSFWQILKDALEEDN